MSQTFCPQCGRLHDPGSGSCDRPPLVGQIVPGDLRVVEPLGQTPVGMTYRAESLQSHTPLQLLVIPPESEGSARLREQLAHAAAIAHPNVAMVHTAGPTADGMEYVAFEVLRGELLAEILEARVILPLPESVDLILQTAGGLQAAHEAGLLHGSLSPETILVTTSEDGRPLVKVIRFGLAQLMLEASEVGARYAAPELLLGQAPTVASDVYSIGAVLHHLLSGAPPLPGTPTGSIGRRMRSVLATALDPAPARRFRSVEAFARALNRASARELEPARWRARALRAAAALVVVGGALWMTHRGPPFGPEPLEPAQPVADTRLATDAARSAGPAAGLDSGAVEAGPPPPSPAEPGESQAAPPEWEPAAPVNPSLAEAPDVPGREDTSGAEATALDEDTSGRQAYAPESPAPAESAPASPAPADPARIDTARIDTARARRLQTPPSRTPPRLAAEAPPPAPRPSAPPARSHDTAAEAREAAGHTLAAYARALETNDLRSVEWIYPGITERERAAWKKFFSVARDLVVNLSIDRFALAGPEAQLDVRGTYRYWNRSLRRSEVAPVRFLATVRREGDSWRLQAIR
jgi:eukaryotic-like serine/threonine-protein kinase